jgi:hypothetical protein
VWYTYLQAGWQAGRKDMLHDNDTSSMAARTSTYSVDVEDVNVLGQQLEVDAQGRTYANDDFDDVFGSAPPSPSFEHDLHIGDGNCRGGGLGNVEPSDIPRLKEKHETEGYRDGVTRGKAQTVQVGFDEGYGLGAVLGLRVGKVLGLIEGIWGPVDATAKGTEGEGNGVPQEWIAERERERLEKLFNEAKEELKTERVFGREWWGEDGIWKFEVPGERHKGKEVLFPDIAAAHPLIKKWEGIVDKEIQKWGLDLGLMETEHQDDETNKAIEKDEIPTRTAPGAVKELSW